MRRLLLFLGLLAWACAACGSPASRTDEVRLWTGISDVEYPVLQQVVEAFERQNPDVRVQLLKVPFEQLRNKFLIAAPADLGPDLLMGPQDWVGVLATAGLLSPLPPGHAPGADFLPATVEAVTFDGKPYAAPLLLDCLALFRNPELMPEAPTSLPDLVRKAVEIDRRGNGVRGFYYDLQDLYFSWAFFNAEGAYVFGTRDGRTDPYDVGLDTPGAVKAALFLRSLRQEHQLVPPGATLDIAKSLYLDRKAAVILNGPWMLGDLRAAGVPYVIDPFPPTAEGRVPKPFVGVQGVMLNRRAAQREKALRLLDHLVSEESLVKLSDASGRPPARRNALRVASRNPDIAAFARLAEGATPMPNHPAVQAVWAPMQQALELITTRPGLDAEAELHATKQRILKKIQVMLE